MSLRTKARTHGGDIKSMLIIKAHLHNFVHRDKNDSPAQKKPTKKSLPCLVDIFIKKKNNKKKNNNNIKKKREKKKK